MPTTSPYDNNCNTPTVLTFNSTPTFSSYAFYTSYAYSETILNEQMTVYCNTATPPALYSSSSLFLYDRTIDYGYVRTITLYVPEGAVDTYKADSVWKKAATIEAYDFN